ncbi:hypothetical protein FRC07_005166 [Ceratobasidium sp. 392]|nr:hypothetical protein FRC07_005166 [Ceratobasidium sp. 392]
MCVAFWSLTHPDYALILTANRDEFISRPTLAAEWHSFDTEPSPSGDLDVLSGRDVMAGGTWLGVNKNGDVAVLTNITELIGKFETSRGELASSFLKRTPSNSLPNKSGPTHLSQYLETISNEQRSYAGFNLLLFSPRFVSNGSVHYEGAIATNSGGGGEIVARSLTDVESLCGGVSNANDSARASQAEDETSGWVKISQGKTLFREIIGRKSWKEDELVDELCEMMSIQNPKPPTTRYELRTTISVPPLPVESNAWSKSITPQSVPASEHAAPALQSQKTDYYCTRLTTVILVRRDGQVDFVERDIWQQVEGKPEPVKADTTSQRRFRFQIRG